MYSGIEFRTARQAIQHAAANGSRAIRLDGRNLIVSQKDADRLEIAGVSFCYLGVVNPDEVVDVILATLRATEGRCHACTRGVS